MNRIKEFRQKRKLKQSELALIVGVNRTAVVKWETGVAQPRTNRLLKIADALRCSVDELLNAKRKQ